MHTDHIKKYAELTSENKRQYCLHNNYDYICYTNILDESRPASWSKVIALLKHLPSYTWILWADADLVIMDFLTKLESIIDNKYDLILPCADFNRRSVTLNAGCFLIKNTMWSRRFLEAAYNKTHLIHHCLWEQQAFTELIEENFENLSFHTKWVHYSVMNQPFMAYRPGEFIVHFCAVDHIRGNINWRYDLTRDFLKRVRKSSSL